MISIHAPLAGSDDFRWKEVPRCQISIHAPLAGSDLVRRCWYDWCHNFNPRSPCGERPTPGDISAMYIAISIHAPLAGSDQSEHMLVICLWISIHAPLAGSDLHGCLVRKGNLISIHAPLAGSDRTGCRQQHQSDDFNPRSPCGERPRWHVHRQRPSAFQSTLPLRGATQHENPAYQEYADFNPRSPCGERLNVHDRYGTP